MDRQKPSSRKSQGFAAGSSRGVGMTAERVWVRIWASRDSSGYHTGGHREGNLCAHQSQERLL